MFSINFLNIPQWYKDLIINAAKIILCQKFITWYQICKICWSYKIKFEIFNTDEISPQKLARII